MPPTRLYQTAAAAAAAAVWHCMQTAVRWTDGKMDRQRERVSTLCSAYSWMCSPDVASCMNTAIHNIYDASRHESIVRGRKGDLCCMNTFKCDTRNGLHNK